MRIGFLEKCLLLLKCGVILKTECWTPQGCEWHWVMKVDWHKRVWIWAPPDTAFWYLVLGKSINQVFTMLPTYKQKRRAKSTPLQAVSNQTKNRHIPERWGWCLLWPVPLTLRMMVKFPYQVERKDNVAQGRKISEEKISLHSLLHDIISSFSHEYLSLASFVLKVMGTVALESLTSRIPVHCSHLPANLSCCICPPLNSWQQAFAYVPF